MAVPEPPRPAHIGIPGSARGLRCCAAPCGSPCVARPHRGNVTHCTKARGRTRAAATETRHDRRQEVQQPPALRHRGQPLHHPRGPRPEDPPRHGRARRGRRQRRGPDPGDAHADHPREPRRRAAAARPAARPPDPHGRRRPGGVLRTVRGVGAGRLHPPEAGGPGGGPLQPLRHAAVHGFQRLCPHVRAGPLGRRRRDGWLGRPDRRHARRAHRAVRPRPGPIFPLVSR